MQNLYKLVFVNLVFISAIISISAMSWFTAWIGLEINLLTFIPLMTNYKNKFMGEAAMKYFITQAMASSLFLFSAIVYATSLEYGINLLLTSAIFMNSALLMKMGAAPFHMWLPQVVKGMKWESIFILLTLQKISPMILLYYSTASPFYLSMIIIFSSLSSGLQGLNQTCLRKIMAYSSINHLSWMISAIINNLTIWFYYFTIYFIINLNIIVIFSKYNIYYIKQLSKLFSFNKKIKIFFMLNFYSLGGLPPFLGFFPKWVTINHMIINDLYMLAFILIIFTLISLYFYLRITFSSFNMSSKKSLMNAFNKMNFAHFTINLFSLIGLLVCFAMSNFY